MMEPTRVSNWRISLPPQAARAPARTPVMPGTVVSAAMTERTSAPVRGVTGHAAVGPDRPAMIMGETTRTYGQLDERARHLASASPIGVAAGPWTKGQISSEMARQSAVADSAPSTANSPRLMRCRITYGRGTLM